MQHTHTQKCKEWAAAKNIVSFLNTQVSFQNAKPQNHPNFPFLREKSGFGTEIALKRTNKKNMVQFGTAQMFHRPTNLTRALPKRG